jgi:hypothetical protein
MKLYLSIYALEHDRFLNYSWYIALITSKEFLASNKQNLSLLD